MIHRHSCWQMYIVDLTRVQSYSFQVPQHADTVELKRCRLNKTNQGEHAGPLYFQKEQNKLLYCLEWSSPTMSYWVVLVFGNVWLFKRGPCLFFLLLQIVLGLFLTSRQIFALFIGWFIRWGGGGFVCFFGEPFGWTCTCVVTCVLQMLNFSPLCRTIGFIDLWFFYFCFEFVPLCPFTLLYVKHLTVNLILVFFPLQAHLILKHKFICPQSEVGLWYVLMLLGCTLFSVLKKKDKKTPKEV